jgi:DNA processing protein
MRTAIFGVERQRVIDSVARVRAVDPADGDAIELVFARAAWSTIAEPGDAAAGALIGAVGAARALAIVLAGDGTRLMQAVPELDSSAAERALARWRPRLASAEVLASLESAGRRGVRLLLPGDESWPMQLDDLGDHAPLALWTLAAPGALDRLGRSIAVIGSRAASRYGEEVTVDAVAGLVGRDYAIVSGGAYGIDGVAHRAALAHDGTTIAFLAGGLDRFYPSGHTELLQRITATGAVVSEVPCGTAPTRFRFLQRNRLIAAASRATIVIEAGSRSGSINTAGHAAALGRPLGAVPGSISSASSAGCHRLLREYDAVCVTSSDEMAELAGGVEEVGSAATLVTASADPTLTRVFDALTSRSSPAERIASRAGLSVADAEGALLLLELDGSAAETATGWRRR